MKLAVIGEMSNEVEYEVVAKVLDAIEEENDTIPFTILSGGTKGVDTHARTWSSGRSWDFVLFKPSFMLDPRHREQNDRDFWIRDKQIVDNCDAMVIIGSKDCERCERVRRHAERKNKKVIRAVL